MPLSLTAISSGAVIDADVLKLRASTIERYVNEQIAAGDRTTNWLESLQVFAPDFQYGGGAAPRVIMPGGEISWRERGPDRATAALFYFANQTNYVPVPGLCATIYLPEVPTSTFRLKMYATFYAFEYGGLGSGTTPNGPRDELGTAANFQFFLDGTAVAASRRKLPPSSNTNNPGVSFSGQIYCRKQVVMHHVEAGSVFTAAGVHHVEVRCQPTAPATASAPEWKHIFVVNGRLEVEHRLR